jgi:hemerythrin-like domain-containing protein
LIAVKAGFDQDQNRGRAVRDNLRMIDTPAMAAPIAAWHTEHVCFNRLLHLLQREVDVFHTGERPSYELMAEIISYLREYGDRFHHRREDVAFARLAKRCPDVQLELARLEQEHRVIAQAGETLLRHIEAILGGAMVPRAEVEMAAATYLVYYGNHIAKEEQDVLPRAAQHLTREDWEAVKAAAPAGADPLFGAVPQERYRDLRRRLG